MKGRDPIRVGLVIGQLTRGGAEGQVAQLAVRLDRARFEPRVYVLSQAVSPWGEWLQTHGVRVTVVDAHVGGRGWQLARAVQRDEIRLLHSWLYLANPFAAIAAVACRIPLIASARNCKVQGLLSRWGNTVAFRVAAGIVANSHDVARYIEREYRAPAARIRVIPNGIDTERFYPPATRSLESPLIVTAGRLVEQKNHALFLEAAAMVHRHRPNVRFAIAGDGPLRATLERLAVELGIEGAVQFLGERGDVDELFREAHLFWLTSRWEGMPNVVLEAMASALPVIVTDVEGCREILADSAAGVVVPPGDAQAFSRHTLWLLSSPEEYRRAAHAARQRAEQFSIGNMVARMEELYDEVS